MRRDEKGKKGKNSNRASTKGRRHHLLGAANNAFFMDRTRRARDIMIWHAVGVRPSGRLPQCASIWLANVCVSTTLLSWLLSLFFLVVYLFFCLSSFLCSKQAYRFSSPVQHFSGRSSCRHYLLYIYIFMTACSNTPPTESILRQASALRHAWLNKMRSV